MTTLDILCLVSMTLACCLAFVCTLGLLVTSISDWRYYRARRKFAREEEKRNRTLPKVTDTHWFQASKTAQKYPWMRRRPRD